MSVTLSNCEVCLYLCYRVIDVGSEWRTFSNEKDTKDASRVGAAEVQQQFTYFLRQTITAINKVKYSHDGGEDGSRELDAFI